MRTDDRESEFSRFPSRITGMNAHFKKADNMRVLRKKRALPLLDLRVRRFCLSPSALQPPSAIMDVPGFPGGSDFQQHSLRPVEKTNEERVLGLVSVWR